MDRWCGVGNQNKEKQLGLQILILAFFRGLILVLKSMKHCHFNPGKQ